MTPSILVAGGISRGLHGSVAAAPFLVLLLWAPFVAVDARRRWLMGEQEKREFQARIDAEDVALFGRPLASFEDVGNERD